MATKKETQREEDAKKCVTVFHQNKSRQIIQSHPEKASRELTSGQGQFFEIFL